MGNGSVPQVLYCIGLGAKVARAALPHPDQATDALEYVNRLAEAGQVEMRALIFELRPETLATDGLVAALERQAAVLRARHQILVETRLCPEPSVSLAGKELLYRVAQEALHNVVKHARATHVRLTLVCENGELRLAVCDNGIGFDPTADYPSHLGLRSMRERAARMKGQLQITSAPKQGTTVQFALPIPKP